MIKSKYDYKIKELIIMRF